MPPSAPATSAIVLRIRAPNYVELDVRSDGSLRGPLEELKNGVVERSRVIVLHPMRCLR
jgi:hypothetical protein